MTPAYAVGEQTSPSAPLLDALVELALQYDGKDRWYLEALGIAARGREDALFHKLRETHAAWSTTWAELLWELRAPASLPYLVAILSDTGLGDRQRIEALDALAAMASPDAARAVESIITMESTPAAIGARAFEHLRRQLFSQWTDARDERAAACRREEGPGDAWIAGRGLAAGERTGRSAVHAGVDDAGTIAGRQTRRFAPRRLTRPPSRKTRRCSRSSSASGKTGRPLSSARPCTR